MERLLLHVRANVRREIETRVIYIYFGSKMINNATFARSAGELCLYKISIQEEKK